MDNPVANNLLLLMLNPEQRGDPGCIISRFLEELQELVRGLHVRWTEHQPVPGEQAVEVAAGPQRFGWLLVEGPPLQDPCISFLRNAAGMLASTLEQRAQVPRGMNGPSSSDHETEPCTRELQLHRARFSTLFQQAARAMLLLNPSGSIKAANERFCESFHVDHPAQLEGRDWRTTGWQFCGEDGLPLSTDMHPVSRACSTGQPVRDVVLGLIGFSRLAPRWFDVCAEPVKDERGNLHEVLVILWEKPEPVDAGAARFKEPAAVLHTQKLLSLGQLASGLAHDFNNLLTGVLGNAALAAQEIPASSTAQDCIRQIEIAARHAAELSRQLAAYAGKGRPMMVPLKLAKEIRDTSKLLSLAISRRHVLVFHLDDKACMVGDPLQIRQLLMNVVLHASQSMGDKDGTITITTGVIHGDRETLDQWRNGENLAEGDYAFLEVADTGNGEEADGKLPGIQTDREGMAAVHHIVQGHHGVVDVDGQAGKGTRFSVLFPHHATPLRQPSIPGNGGSVQQAKGTVLVVDDEYVVRTIAKRMLERAGFTVLVAEDGYKAVQVFQQQSPYIRLVLLDMTMPHMDGFATLRALREIDPQVRVLLSSGFNEDDAGDRIAEAAVAGFVHKPYSVEELQRAVRSAIARPTTPA